MLTTSQEAVHASGVRVSRLSEDLAPLPEPTERLPPDALTYWRFTTAGQAVAALVGALVLGGYVPSPWSTVAPVAVAAIGIAAVVVAPGLRYRRWRYAVRDDEIDIRHGTFVVRRTLVPIRRVQHVETESGPLLGSFGLAAVSFHTAAGETEIPALGSNQAELVRAQIARLARTRDDV